MNNVKIIIWIKKILKYLLSTTLVFTILLFIIWLFFGSYIGSLIYPINVSSFYMHNDENYFTIYLNISNIGHFNLRDVLFSVKADCGSNFILYKLKDNNEVNDCKLGKHPTHLDLKCKEFYKEDLIELEWSTPIKPLNCNVEIEYERSLPYIDVIPVKVNKKSKLIENNEYEVFKGIKIINITPIRNNFYSGQEIVLIYDIFSSDLYNITYTNEWYDSEGFLANRTRTFNDIIVHKAHNPRYAWNSFSIKSGEENFTFKTIIRYSNNKYNESGFNFTIYRNKNFTRYLIQDKNIRWNDTIVEWLLRGLGSSDLISYKDKNDEEKATKLLDITRSIMVNPPEMEKILYYEEHYINSLGSFEKREGRSFEFSAVYTMFLRIIGIPSEPYKSSIDENYYCVRLYLEGKGWVSVDVLNTSKNFLSKSDRCN